MKFASGVTVFEEFGEVAHDGEFDVVAFVFHVFEEDGGEVFVDDGFGEGFGEDVEVAGDGLADAPGGVEG